MLFLIPLISNDKNKTKIFLMESKKNLLVCLNTLFVVDGLSLDFALGIGDDWVNISTPYGTPVTTCICTTQSIGLIGSKGCLSRRRKQKGNQNLKHEGIVRI
jgi:hypothetical protein